MNHPETQQKLRREMDTVLGAGHQVTERDTHRLPYLQAVVKEALRLRMAIPLLVPHMNLRDAELGGHGAAQAVLDVGEHDLGAVPDELRGRRLADAAGAAGDHGHLPSQPLGV